MDRVSESCQLACQCRPYPPLPPPPPPPPLPRLIIYNGLVSPNCSYNRKGKTRERVAWTVWLSSERKMRLCLTLWSRD
ncbi:hypothetical protein SKAU_G00191030 [Synaphobranchus kaupii]|uniref:Uncharacterized protein n=1 Tax=Synaphobranchus kaupii TaxID=118154 RepID=A0A9Q1FDM5_SYNKA|nr:hypothetical protein SKAU_G00191030 [Synaphobranchus kaupii]